MIELGLRLYEIPPFVRKKFSIFTVLRTIWAVRSFVIFWKGRLWQLAIHCYFTTLIRLWMSGIYSFDADRFISEPLVGTLLGSSEARTCRLYALWWRGSHNLGNNGIPPWGLWIFLALCNFLDDWLPWSISFSSKPGRMVFYSQKICCMWGILPCATLSILQGYELNPLPLHTDFSEWSWI